MKPSSLMTDCLQRIAFIWQLSLDILDCSINDAAEPLVPRTVSTGFHFDNPAEASFKVNLRAWDIDACPRIEIDIEIRPRIRLDSCLAVFYEINRINIDACGATLVFDADHGTLNVGSRLVLAGRNDAWAALSGEQIHDLRESTLNWMLPCFNLSRHAARALVKMQRLR